MLGEAVYKQFSDTNNVLATDIDVNEDWLSFLDVRDKLVVVPHKSPNLVEIPPAGLFAFVQVRQDH